jgi:mannose-6-phosphate isomerase
MESQSPAPPSFLLPTAQNYPWGKPEQSSLVYTLAHANTPLLYPPTNKPTPYAELWLGTHTASPTRTIPSQFNASSLSIPNEQTRAQFIDTLPLLRSHRGGNDLPYLFKVLSIAEALSIQSHPHKALAEKLHKAHPDIYKDPNHKPELVLAVTPMRALCGFRPLNQICELLLQLSLLSSPLFEKNEELYNKMVKYSQMDNITPTTIAQDADSLFLKELWSIFHNFNTNNQDEVISIIQTFQQKYSTLSGVYAKSLEINDDSSVLDLNNGILPLCYHLSTLYPTDLAIFSPLFLHYFSLQPGQSIFLSPDTPHAYLYGDCMEVMACSDNVIRAGLTPKFRDVENLLSSLTYEMTMKPKVTKGELLLQNRTSTVVNTIHQPPVGEFDEFMLLETKICPGIVQNSTKFNTTLPLLPTPSILLVLQGDAELGIDYKGENGQNGNVAQTIKVGNCVYLPPHCNVTVNTHTNCLFYQCTQNSPMDLLKKLNHVE